MDKIKKFLKQRSKKEREIIAELICKILANELSGFTPKKLSGYKNLYRIRIGKIRIIFKKEKTGNTIINIDYRGGAYKKL